MPTVIAEPTPAETEELGSAPKTSETTALFDSFRKNMAEAMTNVDGVSNANTGKPKPDEKPATVAPAEPDKADADKAKLDKPAESKPGEKKDDIPAEIKSTKAAETWKVLKGQKDEAVQKLAAAEARVKELEAKAGTATEQSAEVSRLTQELAEAKQTAEQLSERLQVVDIERHPKFEAYYGGKLKAALDLAKRTAGEQGEKLVALLQQPDNEFTSNQIEAIISELTPTKAGIIASIIKDIRAVELEKAGEISRAKENFTRLQQTEAAQREEQTRTLRQRQDQAAVDMLQRARTLEAFKLVEGDEKHNAEVKASEQFVKAFMRGELSDDIFAWTPVLASEALHLRNHVLPGLREENERLKAEVASMTAAAPSAGGDGGAKEESASAEPKSFMEMFHEGMQGQQT